MSIRVPPRPLYVLSDPDDVKQMFLAPADVLHTGNGSATIEKFTGQTGLAWLDENEHKVRRKIIMPSMHGKALQRIEASIDEMAKRDVATWPRQESMALHPHIHRFTLNVIREVIFGEGPPSLLGRAPRRAHGDDAVQQQDDVGDADPQDAARGGAAAQRDPAAGARQVPEAPEEADALIAEAVEERRHGRAR